MNSEESKIDLPCDGEIFYPEQQRFEEMFVFIHPYGGHKKQMRRHIQLVNHLGFRAVAFNLFPQPFQGIFQLLKNPTLYFSSLSSIWGRQILDVLQHIPEKKILFSFSFSCNVIVQIVSKIENVRAVILDGGPFAHWYESGWRYLTYQETIKNPFLRSLVLIPWNLFCGFLFLKSKIHESLQKWPAFLPILSFQAQEDKLVPPRLIQNILTPHDHLDITVALIKNTEHLQGLKVQPQIYQEHLINFLKQKILKTESSEL